jgi:hypothetical protein
MFHSNEILCFFNDGNFIFSQFKSATQTAIFVLILWKFSSQLKLACIKFHICLEKGDEGGVGEDENS